MGSGHDSAQNVISPHADVSTDGTCKRQVILKRSEEDTLIKSSSGVQTDAILSTREPASPGLPRAGLGADWGSAAGELDLQLRVVSAPVPVLLLTSWSDLGPGF